MVAERHINEVLRQFGDAYNRGDAAGCAATYTESARILPPNAPITQGQGAIQAFWQGVMGRGIRSMALETLDCQQAGDTAYVIGTVMMHILKSDGQMSTQYEKYVDVWKLQEDGAWKCDTSIWNSMPAPDA
ncbi:MAG: DUF4440 domain-containing protein [Anaerolineae bacterium]